MQKIARFIYVEHQALLVGVVEQINYREKAAITPGATLIIQFNPCCRFKTDFGIKAGNTFHLLLHMLVKLINERTQQGTHRPNALKLGFQKEKDRSRLQAVSIFQHAENARKSRLLPLQIFRRCRVTIAGNVWHGGWVSRA